MTETTNRSTNDSLKPLKQQAQGDSSSFLDSIFLSSKTMVIMALFVVVTMVIMGWFVFEYNANKYWIVNNAQLIENSKKEHDRLMVTKAEMPVVQEEKERLVAEAENAQNEAENAQKELVHFQSELKEVRREIDDKEEIQNDLEKKIADATTRKNEALRLADEAEKDIEDLRPLQQELNRVIQIKREEVSNLDGKSKAIKQQIE